MSGKPILFNGDMVRALLDGIKTQTRRLVDFQPENHVELATNGNGEHFADDFESDLMYFKCPFGKAGDLLWVRETFSKYDDGLVYRATHEQLDGVTKWTPSIHMPRWASRLTLKITNVRVERVQDISTDDIKSEGIIQRFPNVNDKFTPKILMGAFMELWGSIYNNWGDNPWVWVYDFEVIKANIDDVN